MRQTVLKSVILVLQQPKNTLQDKWANLQRLQVNFNYPVFLILR